MLYQPGDRVVVREDLEDGGLYSVSDNKTRRARANSDMVNLAGQAVTIKAIRFDIYYRIEEDDRWVWTDGMFSGLEEKAEIFDVEDLL